MAATNFRALIFFLYFALFRLSSQGLTHLFKDNSYCCYPWTTTGDQKSDFTWFFISSQPVVVRRALSSTGFCQTRVSLSKWTKDGYLSQYPGHDPPVDLTVYKDVLKNPGPESFQNVLHRRNYDLHTHCSTTTTTTYSRAQLFGIRHRSNFSLDYSIVPVLKSIGFFKYRGRRGGQRISQRKIPVIISYRPDIARSNSMISQTLVNINIDQQRSGKQFKLCCLNAT